MSSARDNITNLLFDLEKTFKDRRVSDNDRKIYFDCLYGTLDAASSISTYVNGHSTITLIQSTRTALQHVAAETTDERLRQWWNPVTAALLTNFERLALDFEMNDISSRLSETSLVRPSGSQPMTTSSHEVNGPSPKKSSLIKKKAKVSAQQQANTNSKVTQLDDTTTVKIRTEKIKGPWFTNLSHVKCVLEECTFCENLWHALHLTRCVDVKCHRKGTTCNAYGWSAHVFPTMWVSAKRDHDNGRPFPGLNEYLKPRESQISERLAPQPVLSDQTRSGSPTFAEIVCSKRAMSVDYNPESPQTKVLRSESPVDWNTMMGDSSSDALNNAEHH